LVNGKDSKFIKELKERIRATPLSEVQKLELENMLQEIVARSIAFDVDSYVNQLLIQKIKSLDPKLVDYEADVYAIQTKLIELEKDINFHRVVISDLKNQYVETNDEMKKREILEEIDKREDAIKKHQKLYKDYMDQRNKVRKEMDKRDTTKKMVELKEKETMKNVIDVSELD